MALDRRVRRAPGLVFAKLLGTGAGRTFTPRDADPHHWGLLATWSSTADADAFESSRVVRRWADLADETLRVRLRPLSSKGSWSGRQPFGPSPAAAPRPDRSGTEPAARWDGPVAAITRARLRWRTMPRFLAASPAVAEALWSSPGLVVATGIGEAPVGLQGTFSLWRRAADLTSFAYRRPEHVDVVRRTPEEDWYAEELFARFAVVAVTGRFAGRDIPAALTPPTSAEGPPHATSAEGPPHATPAECPPRATD